jgi:hypothetical protein
MNQMSRPEQRTVIRYLTFKSLSVAEITTKLQNVCGTNPMKDLMVSKWRLHFQDGLDLRRLEQDQ